MFPTKATSLIDGLFAVSAVELRDRMRYLGITEDQESIFIKNELKIWESKFTFSFHFYLPRDFNLKISLLVILTYGNLSSINGLFFY